jgi:hypothetical protein
MITPDGKLLVFEEFQTDFGLPKHRQPVDSAEVAMRKMTSDEFEQMVNQAEDAMTMQSGSPFRQMRPIRVRRSVVLNSIEADSMSWSGADAPPLPNKPSFWQRLKRVFVDTPEQPWRTEENALPPEPSPSLSVIDFFTAVKASTKELDIIEARGRGYEREMASAAKLGQVARFEQLRDGLAAAAQEARMVGLGLHKYVAEADIVDFYKKCPKGLRLDWIANFTRSVPDAVLETKVRADETCLFDNYVVLHYDPDGKSYAETETEKKAKEDAKKDPILFGLMKGKRRLYFVGDWVDELCDLTLDEVADVVGRAVPTGKSTPISTRGRSGPSLPSSA